MESRKLKLSALWTKYVTYLTMSSAHGDIVAYNVELVKISLWQMTSTDKIYYDNLMKILEVNKLTYFL